MATGRIGKAGPGTGSAPRLVIPSKIYGPAGYCIYCGNTTTTLERDDVVPVAMLGRLVLPQARCPDCAQVIDRCEIAVVENLLGRSRAGARRRIRGLSVAYIDPEDATELAADARPAGITADDIPRRIVLPRFDLPDLLEPGSPDREEFWQTMPFADPDDRPDGEVRYDRDAFCRMLAKIGHAFAVATVPAERLEAFELLLPNMIRFGTADPFVFVGGMLRHPQRTERAYAVECRTHLVEGTQTEFLAAHITLFPCFGGPEYVVAVGKRTEAAFLQDAESPIEPR